MSGEYKRHPLSRQMRELSEEDVLKDIQVVVKPSGWKTRASSFALCLLSPVFHKMICGGFRESSSKEIVLDNVDGPLFVKVLALGFGFDDVRVRDMVEAVEVGKLADQLQMLDVRSAIEEMVVRCLTLEECAEVLCASHFSGLSVVEEECRRLALNRFEDLATTSSFAMLSEETLGSLLEEDDLVAVGEEMIFAAVVRWMKGGERPTQGETLLKKIRFAVMSEDFLLHEALGTMPENELLRELVREARLVQQDPRRMGEAQYLCERALHRRKVKGVRWEEYEGGGERRLSGHAQEVLALAHCEGRVCSGSEDGTIRVWNRSSLEAECVLGTEDGNSVWCIAWWEGRAISGHDDGRLKVWDVCAAAACEAYLVGHQGAVRALAVCGDRLLSSSDDCSIRVWRRLLTWGCERELRGHIRPVLCLAVWGTKALSGGGDDTIRVWDVDGGAHETTLRGHTSEVTALAVHGRRAYSASYDGTVMAWALGTWELLQTVAVHEAAGVQWIQTLAVCGVVLVGGSSSSSLSLAARDVCAVRVWRLDDLECLHTFAQPAGCDAWSLSAAEAGGEVWAGVGSEVVVWGRGVEVV